MNASILKSHESIQDHMFHEFISYNFNQFIVDRLCSALRYIGIDKLNQPIETVTRFKGDN